jgi:glycosyltransferase A (GT-A) superfamily protein (DUF2064 family)
MLRYTPGQPARAILFFTRSPESEASSKRFDSGFSRRQRVRFFESLTSHTLRQSNLSGIPVVIVTDRPEYNFRRLCPAITSILRQRGEVFGEKILAAVQDTFALGFDQIVCVGNDCPRLSARDILSAFQQLSGRGVALGRSHDGGVYLIGLRSDTLEAAGEIMTHSHWETTYLCDDLLAAAGTLNLPVAVLSLHDEIDTVADLYSAGNALPGLSFLRYFVTLFLAQLKLIRDILGVLPQTMQTRILRFQKAPPQALLHY